MVPKKRRTVHVSGNTIKAQDICLDTQQSICHFEIHPEEATDSMLVYIGNGYVCIRKLCENLIIDGYFTHNVSNQSNMCVCNFLNITGCDFNYTGPVTSYTLLKENYTLYRNLLPSSIKMNLMLLHKPLKHGDLQALL